MYKLVKNAKEEYTNIVNLYKECFKIISSVKKVTEKYNTVCFGHQNIGFFASTEQEKRVAYYGVFPLKMKVNGVIIDAAQSGDTMTSPDHQKKGLFVLLANATYDLCKDEGLQFVFGFPNENSYPGFAKKLDWVFFGVMNKFVFKVFTLPGSDIVYHIEFLRPLYNAYVKMLLSKYKLRENIPYNQFNYPYDVNMVNKDDIFFKYKTQNSNCYIIKLNGNIIFLKVDGSLVIGDIAFRNDFNALDCIKDLTQLARYLLCRKITFSVSKNHWLYEMLIQLSEPQPSLPIGFKFFKDGISGDKFKFSAADFDTF